MDRCKRLKSRSNDGTILESLDQPAGVEADHVVALVAEDGLLESGPVDGLGPGPLVLVADVERGTFGEFPFILGAVEEEELEVVVDEVGTPHLLGPVFALIFEGDRAEDSELGVEALGDLKGSEAEGRQIDGLVGQQGPRDLLPGPQNLLDVLLGKLEAAPLRDPRVDDPQVVELQRVEGLQLSHFQTGLLVPPVQNDLVITTLNLLILLFSGQDSIEYRSSLFLLLLLLSGGRLRHQRFGLNPSQTGA